MHKKEIKHILLCGSFHGKNKGDEAIAEAEILFFEEHFPEAQITLATQNPEYFLTHYTGISAVSITHPIAFLRALHLSTHVIIGGGGLFFEPRAGHAFHVLRNQSYVWSLLCRYARFFGKTVFLIGVGVETMRTRISEWILRFGLNAANHIMVRDAASEAYLRSIGVKATLTTTADSAFLFSPTVDPGSNTKDTIRVGVSFHYGISILERETYIDEWVTRCAERLLTWARQQAIRVEWVSVPMHPKDAELTERVFALLRNHDQQTSIMNMKQKPSALLHEFAELDMQIGMRMHGAILATIADVPFVLLSYARKVDEYMARIARYDPDAARHLSIPYQQIERINEAMQYALEHADRIRAMQKKCVHEAHTEASEAICAAIQ